ncbi:MAG: hypothetical protein K9M57_06280 [Phycisphaerae bacterium]|nr:hypothetical protein [Phycisphaerae bacterium]
MKVTMDNYTRFILTTLTVLLLFISLALWCQTPSVLPTAEARIPDSGMQLNQINDNLTQLNKTLSGIQKLLVSGNAKVQTMTAEDLKAQGNPKNAIGKSINRDMK